MSVYKDAHSFLFRKMDFLRMLFVLFHLVRDDFVCFYYGHMRGYIPPSPAGFFYNLNCAVYRLNNYQWDGNPLSSIRFIITKTFLFGKLFANVIFFRIISHYSIYLGTFFFCLSGNRKSKRYLSLSINIEEIHSI